MADLPHDAAKLLAVSPDKFVAERKRLAGELRDEGRDEDARAVAETKKPPSVVLAVNRAARDRPQAAKDAAGAARRIGSAQLSGEQEEYRAALKEMEQASMLLTDVALANLSRDRTASAAMRRRVVDLVRGALASEDTRQLLVRGALTDEVETAGFEAFAGLPMPASSRRQTRRKSVRDSDEDRRARDELRNEITGTKRSLDDAERRVREATLERDKLATHLASLERKRDAER
jgi:hypothetical protein